MRPRPDLDCCTTKKKFFLANKFLQYECRVGAEHVFTTSFMHSVISVSDIWGSDSAIDEASSLVRFYALSTGTYLPKFLRTVGVRAPILNSTSHSFKNQRNCPVITWTE